MPPQIGPRMELEVVKVEEGLCDGRVLFHSHVNKSPAERAALQQRKETEVQLKDVRRKQQVRRRMRLGAVRLGDGTLARGSGAFAGSLGFRDRVQG